MINACDLVKKFGGFVDYSTPTYEMVVFFRKGDAKKSYLELQKLNAELSDLFQDGNRYCFKVF